MVSSITASSIATASNTTALAQYFTAGDNKYACRQSGSGPGVPTVVPAAFYRHARQLGSPWAPTSRTKSASRPVRKRRHRALQRKGFNDRCRHGSHVMKLLDALGLSLMDVLGFSLGGMVAQLSALKRPTLLRRIILTRTEPEGGIGVVMDRPDLLKSSETRRCLRVDRLNARTLLPSVSSRVSDP